VTGSYIIAHTPTSESKPRQERRGQKKTGGKRTPIARRGRMAAEFESADGVKFRKGDGNAARGQGGRNSITYELIRMRSRLEHMRGPASESHIQGQRRQHARRKSVKWDKRVRARVEGCKSNTLHTKIDT
jgi:hypothetical protein